MAVGTVQHDDETAELAFFASTDTGWTIVQRVASETGQPVWDGTSLVPTADGLLAIRNTTDPVAQLWASADGRSWREIVDSSWTDAWADADFVGVASGPNGIVAIEVWIGVRIAVPYGLRCAVRMP